MKDMPVLQIREEDLDFLIYLQNLHDFSFNWKDSGFNISCLKIFAANHNLEYKEQ